MRHAFIVNPTSGQGSHSATLADSINSLIARHPEEDISLHLTRFHKDAVDIASNLAEEASSCGEEIVIYACGGDGTVHEVANGLIGFDNAHMGIVPVGSGNDLIREVAAPGAGSEDYLNLELQLSGHPRRIDALRVSSEDGGLSQSFIAVNGINIGFDGNTGIRASELKSRPLLEGSFAYLAAVFVTLIKKEGQNLRITADGELFHEGELLLATVGNGGYCGGGIRSLPNAEVDDGYAELMAIKDMSRISFIRKFPKFKVGRLFDIPGVEEFVTYKRAAEIIIEPLGALSMRYLADGEIKETGEVRIEIMPKALSIWDIEKGS